MLDVADKSLIVAAFMWQMDARYGLELIFKHLRAIYSTCYIRCKRWFLQSLKQFQG